MKINKQLEIASLKLLKFFKETYEVDYISDVHSQHKSFFRYQRAP